MKAITMALLTLILAVVTYAASTKVIRVISLNDRESIVTCKDGADPTVKGVSPNSNAILVSCGRP